jgi:hypothetical protein
MAAILEADGHRRVCMRPMARRSTLGGAYRQRLQRFMARTLVGGPRLARGLRMQVGGCRQVRRQRTEMHTVRGSSRILCLMYRVSLAPADDALIRHVDILHVLLQLQLNTYSWQPDPKTFFFSYIIHLCPLPSDIFFFHISFFLRTQLRLKCERILFSNCA